MYDTIQIEMPFSNYPDVDDRDEKFEWKGILFSPNYNKAGGVTNHYAQVENLRINVTDGYKLYAENSLHKYLKGENYSDFTRSEVIEAIDKLEYFIPNSSKGIVKKIASGVNYVPDTNKEWLNHRLKQFAPMLAKGKQYGYKCYHSDYSVKGYNKEFEVLSRIKGNNKPAIQKGLFRYEIENNYLRRFKSKLPPIQLRDLANVEVMEFFADDLKKQFKLIKMNIIDFSKLTDLDDIRVASVMVNKEAIEALRNYSSERLNKYNSKYKKILKRQSNDKTLPIIEDKIEHLISA